jgi:hypothetical protein
MITFAEARRLAVNYMARWYPLESSAYAADVRGWGDETHWHVRVGDFRYVVEGDQRYRREGTPTVAVDRRTGEVTLGMPSPREAPSSERDHAPI